MKTKLKRDKRIRKTMKAQGGFTLFEILIVLAILSLVIGVLVGPKIMAAFADAKDDTAKIQVKDIKNELIQWKVRHPGKSCPAKITDIRRDSTEEDFKDPWGTPLKLHCGPTKPPKGKMGVSSAGGDEKPGTGDDINSWE